MSAPALTIGAAAFAALSGCAAWRPGATDSETPFTAGPLTPRQAARFLSQAAFGATPELIARVQAMGPAAWIDEQLQWPRGTGHVAWMLENGYGEERFRNNFQGVDNTLWRQLMGAPDVLRQRVALALSEIFVVSMQGLPVPWRGLVAAHYMDILEEQAFGHYRNLLEAITLSPAMGLYLNMRGNRRGDPATGRVPDENYAREVLPLLDRLARAQRRRNPEVRCTRPSHRELRPGHRLRLGPGVHRLEFRSIRPQPSRLGTAPHELCGTTP